MERTVYTERLYSLGDFKNIKFSTALTGIPEEMATNDRIINLLFFQQALSCEIAYRKYYDLIDHISKNLSTTRNIAGKSVTVADPEAVLSFLEEQRTQTMQELYKEIREAGEKKYPKESTEITTE